jgi:Domain of unknown function (DUF4872)/Butirosin biosynthesis protein H, N-terminal
MNGIATYVHRQGIHCESACQVNILAANGHEVAEEDVFGLDGSFGFAFFSTNDDTPDIVVGKQEIMPLRAARLMGIEVQTHAPKSSPALGKLVESSTAVMTRVDIGLLPHWNLEGRSSFGGYFVNVVGALDGGFEISDAAEDAPQFIAEHNLHAARSSRATPPLNPNQLAYTFGQHRTELRMDRVGPVAVRTLCRNVLKPGNRSLGIPGLKSLQSAAQSWPQAKQGEVEDIDLAGNVSVTSALGRQLLHLGRQIELFGTGGGLFRPLISRFLVRVGDATDHAAYTEAAERFSASGERWHELGTALLSRGHSGSSSELQDLVDAVVDTAKSTASLERDALSGLLASTNDWK